MIFETQRLIARRFDPRDLADDVAMRSDPDVARYQNWTTYTEADARQRLESLAHGNPGDPGWFQFVLEERTTSRFIGDCGLRIIETDGRLAQIGYTIAKPHWNHGFATEAVVALTEYAFGNFLIHRITASVDPRNVASCRVLEKAGYAKEAHFRQSEWFKGEWADDAIYARLRA
jgi:RimJ/RimL family protein N-acetyltransferase